MATAPPRRAERPSDARPPGLLPWLAEPLGKLSRSEILGLLLLLALALAIRIPGMNKESFDDAEAMDVYGSMYSPPSDLLSGERAQNHPPLFLLAMKLWMSAFGRSMTAIRLLPVVGGITSICLLFLLALRVFGMSTAFTVTALAGLSFTHILHSRVSRSYIFLYLVVVSSLIILFYLLERPATGAFILFALVNAIGLYTHYYYVFFFMTHVIVILLEGRTRDIVVRTIASTFSAGTLFLPVVVVYLWKDFENLRRWPHSLDYFSLRTLWDILLRFMAIRHPSTYNELFFPRWTPVALVALVILGAACFRALRDRHLRVVLLYLFGPLIIFNLTEPLTGPLLFEMADASKLFIIILPAFHLALSRAISLPKRPILVIILLILLLTPSLWVMYYDHSVLIQPDWRSAADYLSTVYSPNMTVLVFPAYLFYSVSLALPEGWPHTYGELKDYNFHVIRNENSIHDNLFRAEEADANEPYQAMPPYTLYDEFIIITTRHWLRSAFPEGDPFGDYELKNASMFEGDVFIARYAWGGRGTRPRGSVGFGRAALHKSLPASTPLPGFPLPGSSAGV